MFRMMDADNALKSRFLANARNDLNDPIASILGLTARLMTADPGDAERVRIIARLLHAEAFALGGQLANVFAAADLEAGDAAPAWSWVDVSGLIRGVIADHRYGLEDRALAIRLDDQLTIGPVVTDAAKLRLVVANLLANAIGFSRPGGEITITLAHDASTDACVLAFGDQGVGIPPEVHDRIFDRFYSRGDGHRGFGLGLAVVQDLMALLGGEITVTSEEGCGSTFSLRLPVKRDLDPECESAEGNDLLFAPEPAP